jgi:hypothetical protein
MNLIARIIAELIQYVAFILTVLNGYWTWRTWHEVAEASAKAAADKVSFEAPTLFGMNSVLFFLCLAIVCLAFFLLASTCRAILETARNTERLMEIMEARNPEA